MLVGQAAVQAVIEELRARSWVIAGTPAPDAWTATHDERPSVTVRLPVALLDAYLAGLADEGLIAELFGDIPPGQADAALAAYLMERLDEMMSASSAGGPVVEVGLRSTNGKPVLYSIRAAGQGPTPAVHEGRDDLHWTPVRPTGAGPVQ